jgi:hypothetical protein
MHTELHAIFYIFPFSLLSSLTLKSADLILMKNKGSVLTNTNQN